MPTRLLLAIVLLAPAAVGAQSSHPLAPQGYGLVYDVPGTERVRVHEDVPYLVVGRDTLTLDVYVPPGLSPDDTRGAVLFVNGIGDPRPNRVKRWAIYSTWPRVVAASGLIGIAMDASRDSVQRSIAGAIDFIAGARGRRLGIDTSRVALYAASANVGATLQYLRGDGRSPAVRAVALYYGFPPTANLPSIPTMFVVAQGDAPGQRAQLDTLWRTVVSTAAPWRLVFGRDLPHAFDALTDSDDARRLIRETLAFWRSHLEPIPPFGARPAESAEGRDILESLYANDFARSVELLERWVARNPNDAMALERLGLALANLQRRPEAERAYRRSLALDSTSAQTYAGLGALYTAQSRWPEAVAAYQRAAAINATNPFIRSQLGFALLGAGRNEEGARSYEEALRLGIPAGAPRAQAAYNLACAYARLGRIDEAFAMLDLAVEHGLTRRQQYETDADLAPLRQDPRFRRLLERLTT